MCARYSVRTLLRTSFPDTAAGVMGRGALLTMNGKLKLALIFAAGVILADRVRQLPVVGSYIPRV
jgi:hypothetical protein